MRNVKLFIAVSIDGYIAKPDGNIDWLEDPSRSEKNKSDYGYEEFYTPIDSTLMGYKTYQEIIGFGIPFPYPDKQNFVFSKNHKKEGNYPVEFIHSNVVDFVDRLKKNEGKDIWLIGGGQINGILLNANLIDMMIVSIVPVVLGGGIPLFGSDTQMKRFTIHKVQEFGGSLIQTTYKRNLKINLS